MKDIDWENTAILDILKMLQQELQNILDRGTYCIDYAYQKRTQVSTYIDKSVSSTSTMPQQFQQFTELYQATVDLSRRKTSSHFFYGGDLYQLLDRLIKFLAKHYPLLTMGTISIESFQNAFNDVCELEKYFLHSGKKEEFLSKKLDLLVLFQRLKDMKALEYVKGELSNLSQDIESILEEAEHMFENLKEKLAFAFLLHIKNILDIHKIDLGRYFTDPEQFYKSIYGLAEGAAIRNALLMLEKNSHLQTHYDAIEARFQAARQRAQELDKLGPTLKRVAYYEQSLDPRVHLNRGYCHGFARYKPLTFPSDLVSNDDVLHQLEGRRDIWVLQNSQDSFSDMNHPEFDHVLFRGEVFRTTTDIAERNFYVPHVSQKDLKRVHDFVEALFQEILNATRAYATPADPNPEILLHFYKEGETGHAIKIRVIFGENSDEIQAITFLDANGGQFILAQDASNPKPLRAIFQHIFLQYYIILEYHKHFDTCQLLVKKPKSPAIEAMKKEFVPISFMLQARLEPENVKKADSKRRAMMYALSSDGPITVSKALDVLKHYKRLVLSEDVDKGIAAFCMLIIAIEKYNKKEYPEAMKLCTEAINSLFMQKGRPGNLCVLFKTLLHSIHGLSRESMSPRSGVRLLVMIRNGIKGQKFHENIANDVEKLHIAILEYLAIVEQKKPEEDLAPAFSTLKKNSTPVLNHLLNFAFIELSNEVKKINKAPRKVAKVTTVTSNRLLSKL